MNATQKTSVFANGLIWFGAAVSIAEILTGTLLTPLGFGKGLLAIILGHAIGCALLGLAGLIGGRTGKSAMETVKLSFGQRGSLLFSVLNVLQLVGWTAVMIEAAASAAGAVAPLAGPWSWSLIIGALVAIWLLVGLANLSRLNTAAMALLFALTLILSTLVFKEPGGIAPAGSLSFGAAVELSVAMPLSWLPLISDYTRMAARPGAAALASGVVYFLVSCWMYAIGLGAALFAGSGDVAAILVRAGLGLMGLLIVIFSTVTTTYLDAYSAGVSSVSISGRLKEKPVSLIVCALGVLLALLTSAARFEGFLYLIGSVFAPMTAILLTDYFILKKDHSAKAANWANLLLWLAGFIIYRLLMLIETPLGNTLPVMLVTMLLCLLVNKTLGGKPHAR